MAEYKVTDIKGIGEEQEAKLAESGITTVAQLLETAGSVDGRKQLAANLGMTPKDLLEWVNRADLFRIKGISRVYSNLLENAGVDTVVELAARKPANLYAKLVEVAKEHSVSIPFLKEANVEAWVAEAKTLPRAIHY